VALKLTSARRCGGIVVSAYGDATATKQVSRVLSDRLQLSLSVMQHQSYPKRHASTIKS
jgi:hypothetical protein